MASSEAEQQLRAAVEAAAAHDFADVLAEARVEAKARVKAILVDALTTAMVARAESALAQPGTSLAQPGTAFVEPATTLAQPTPAPTQPAAGPTHPHSDPAPPEPDATHDPNETVFYVYGVLKAGAEVPSDLVGVDRHHPPGLIEEGELAALTSLVPQRDFDEEHLKDRLGSLEWVERTARAHEAVLEAMADVTTVVPMRLCSVYRSEESVRGLLEREEQPLRDALAHLANKTEWAVKVFAHERGAQAEPAAPQGEAPASGTEYMRRRQDEREQRLAADAEIHAACTEIHEQLRALVDEAITAPPQRPEVSGRSGQMVLNGIYLVADGQIGAFLAEVENLQEEYLHLGLDLVPTGPWPPYNFVPGTIGAGW